MTDAAKGHYRKATGDPMTTENIRYQPSVPGLTAVERRWLATDPHDPRPTCPNRQQHAVVRYGERWSEGYIGYPRLDGMSVQKTHRQTRCGGCMRYTIWTPRGEEMACQACAYPKALWVEDMSTWLCRECQRVLAEERGAGERRG